jgi:hypothetical protein
MMIFIPPCIVPHHLHSQLVIVGPNRDLKEPQEEGHSEREDYTPNGWDSRFTGNTAAVTGALIRNGDAPWGIPAPTPDLLASANSALQNLKWPKKNRKPQYGQLHFPTVGSTHTSLRRLTSAQLTCPGQTSVPYCPIRRFVRDKRI